MEEIFKLAKKCGFDLAGVAPTELPGEDFERYRGWVQEGRAGQMAYLEKDVMRRRAVTAIMSEAKSVICLGINYYPGPRATQSDKKFGISAAGPTIGQPCPARPCPAPIGLIARYAYGPDYHKILAKMLKNLTRALTQKFPQNQFKTYADTGAVLEKAYARAAGLGVIGENTTLITPEFGSFVFLAEIITDLEIPPTLQPAASPDASAVARSSSKADTKFCTHCGACLKICPTGALISPYKLDARRCISYLTIENRGPIPIEFRPLIGDHLFGCDLCLEICPQNQKRAQIISSDSPFAVRIGGDTQFLAEILNIRTDEEFNKKFQNSPIKRAKREGLLRNACVVVANTNSTELLPLLHELAKNDPSPLVREHAIWAINQL